jgi:hypothetical protein
MSDLVPMSNLDSDMRPTPTEFEVFSVVNEAVSRATITGDLGPVINTARSLRRSVQARGLALAKLLHDVRRQWAVFEAAGCDDTFEDYIHAEIGIVPQTSRKYANMWAAVFEGDLSDDIKRRLMDKPIRTLNLLTAAAENNDDLDWDVIVEATNHAEVQAEIKRIRGEQTSSKLGIMISLDIRTGSLTAYQDGKQEEFGYVNVNKEGLAQRAINRIVRSAHITER